MFTAPVTVYSRDYCLQSRLLFRAAVTVYSLGCCLLFRLLFREAVTVYNPSYCLQSRLLFTVPVSSYSLKSRLLFRAPVTVYSPSYCVQFLNGPDDHWPLLSARLADTATRGSDTDLNQCRIMHCGSFISLPGRQRLTNAHTVLEQFSENTLRC